MKKIIGFIPARGGSSRVPKKNLKNIAGVPLFLRACYNLNQVLDKKDIVVDSDDVEILTMAESHGFSILKRPGELATNATDGNSFFRWETSNYPDADIYIQHLPPMPFLSKETIEKGLNALAQGYDSIGAWVRNTFIFGMGQSKFPCMTWRTYQTALRCRRRFLRQWAFI